MSTSELQENNIVVEAKGVLSSPSQIQYFKSRLYIPKNACVLKNPKNRFLLYSRNDFLGESLIREYIYSSYEGGWRIPRFTKYENMLKPRLLVVNDGRCFIEQGSIDDLLYRRRIPELFNSCMNMLVGRRVDR